MRQIAGIESSTLNDGKACGLRQALVYNGTGLHFSVLLDRGLDIGRASYKGVPIAYITPTGYAHPAFYEEEDLRWLRNWHAGLMTGCGFQNVGLPQAYEDMTEVGPLGLHGRLSNTPAENCSFSEEWEGSAYKLTVSGQVRMSAFTGENLLLKRTLETGLGDNSITIQDRVTNESFRPSPLMLLYHINIGYPMLSEDAVLTAREHDVIPRNDEAAVDLDSWNLCTPPVAGMTERCYFHDIPEDKDGLSRMTLENPSLKMAIEIACRKRELPLFNQWKMMGESEYIMGLEPCNCRPDGLADERKRGTLYTLKPHETREFYVKITMKDL